MTGAQFYCFVNQIKMVESPLDVNELIADIPGSCNCRPYWSLKILLLVNDAFKRVNASSMGKGVGSLPEMQLFTGSFLSRSVTKQ